MTDYSNLTPVITKLADKIKTWASDAEAIEAWADTIQTEQRIDPTLYDLFRCSSCGLCAVFIDNLLVDTF